MPCATGKATRRMPMARTSQVSLASQKGPIEATMRSRSTGVAKGTGCPHPDRSHPRPRRSGSTGPSGLQCIIGPQIYGRRADMVMKPTGEFETEALGQQGRPLSSIQDPDQPNSENQSARRSSSNSCVFPAGVGMNRSVSVRTMLHSSVGVGLRMSEICSIVWT